ncbi:Uncharacterized protein BM_BM9848 [Brugia malayi]|uniref:Uncharacterized protein n=1 Tax=Brugia malayi TaxID=6279 RepID=A0A4E9FYI4_BRUMA|nr:Uncharacterized protein BM_BM9848 [Brugia malayi]VIO99553.1 Uncharacterized protein BM_BM9848 [Brugia malayi]
MLRIAITIYSFCALVSDKMVVEAMPSVSYVNELRPISQDDDYYLISGRVQNKVIRSFHRLEFNDSIKIRMKHYSYSQTLCDKTQCIIIFNFLDEHEDEIVRLTINPGTAEFSLLCVSDKAITAAFPNNTYNKYYEFLLLFSNIGIMLFYNEYFKVKVQHCINQITNITSFQHIIAETFDFEASLEVRAENARIPGNWHVVESIPADHKVIIKYYPNEKSIITIQLADRNGITALNVIIDYTTGILYTRRMRLDNENKQCVNFGSTPQFTTQMLGKVEIGIFPQQYKITMQINERSQLITADGCLIYGHHLSPYDIQQIIFDSTNKRAVFYAYYIYQA